MWRIKKVEMKHLLPKELLAVVFVFDILIFFCYLHVFTTKYGKFISK